MTERQRSQAASGQWKWGAAEHGSAGYALVISPGASARTLRAGWERTPLWMRLMAGVLVLVALALVATGVFGAQLLRGYLLERVDAQLRQASTTLLKSVQNPQSPGWQLGQPLPSEFSALILDADGQAVARLRSPLSAGQSQPSLPSLTARESYRRANQPFTVPSQSPGGPQWRTLATPVADGSGSLLVATSLEEVGATVSRLLLIDLLIGVVVLVGLGVAGYVVVRASLRPLTQVEATAESIAAGDLSRRVPGDDPRTEVGRLSRALNVMLGRIEQAFQSQRDSEAEARRSEERMRQFIADASHELRTPLASIRGFAELYRQRGDADSRDQGGEQEDARIVGRIEQEATRMGVLVDDLLLLARLDQQRPIDRRPVDMIAIAVDTVTDARARAPGHPVELQLDRDRGPEGPSPVVVPGDEYRLRQVLGNLVSNALTHTPTGTRIFVRVRATERNGYPVAVAEVTDEGPGLDQEQVHRVFERFYRGDPSRSRARGGTGLGLSIVSALVAAHGGAVEVDSAPEQGATFRVLLPLGS